MKAIRIKKKKKSKTLKNEPSSLHLLDQIYNNPHFHDVVFLLGKEETKAYGHKLVLSMNSPIWKGMFYTQEWMETKGRDKCLVRIPDLDPKVFLGFLEWIYTRKAKISHTTIYGIYKLAHKYCIPGLKKYCTGHFRKILNGRNCLRHAERSATEGISIWHKISLNYLMQNSKKFMNNSKCFIGLREETVRSILEMKDLNCEEILVFRALKRWAENIQNDLIKKNKTKIYELILINPDQKKITARKLVKKYLHLIRLDLMDFNHYNELIKSGYYDHTILLKEGFKVVKKFDLKAKTKSRSGPQLSDCKILLVGWCRSGETHVSDLINSLKSGGIENVTHMDPTVNLPSLKAMLRYDAIVVRSSNVNSIRKGGNLGSNLAKYVDAGNGVIVIAINTLINSPDKQIRGKFQNQNYIPLKIAERERSEQRSLGKVFSPNHPIMRDVKTFKCKDYTHFIKTNDLNGGRIIASWDNGYPLITEKRRNDKSGIVVCFNFHPISTRITNDCGKAWLQETDGNLIFSNTLSYLIKDKLSQKNPKKKFF
ncbi:btb (poz) domain-containing 2a-related [Anaeramoeba flamelloides]|uniref:Btb (Poz) domain-containing 2a-related n=1 Tax=Anaeramoeba flamelloides TaxID=1746091 RepID=A0ABQ8X6V1_9EUKA|nr:btb (poz) domain-containing 2a-related [Anaeramoeba flamelloides]